MMTLLEEGQPIRNGDFVVERFLGEGFFAEVYRIRHQIIDQRQALKIFKTPGSVDEVRLMLDEARLLTGLGHRNIVRVYDAGIHQTGARSYGFFTMEYLEGGSLEQFRLQHQERLVPVPVTVGVLRQVCQGLGRAHGRRPPLIHRDIRPQNILIGEDEEGLRACLSDFGLAKHVNPLKLKASTKGAPCYRAPECYDDPQAASCAADVWALGLTAYLMLTDRFPYAGADLDEIKPEHFRRPLVPASSLNGGVDERLDRILARALAIDPAERYPHAMALLQDLEAWGRTGVDAPRPAAPRPRPEADLSGEQEARPLVARALQLAPSRLEEASQLLQRAMDAHPPYREQYKGLLKAWLSGKVM
ncbi:MAG TPA: serine/threonine-protein kinase [Pyrinomonadaceae bacterium]|jgi:serine/threonine-protein kinase